MIDLASVKFFLIYVVNLLEARVSFLTLILCTFEQEVVFKLQHLKSNHADLYTHAGRCLTTLPSFRWKGQHALAYTSLHKVETNVFLLISEAVTSEQVTKKKLDSIPVTLPPLSLRYLCIRVQFSYFIIRGAVPVKI